MTNSTSSIETKYVTQFISEHIEGFVKEESLSRTIEVKLIFYLHDDIRPFNAFIYHKIQQVPLPLTCLQLEKIHGPVNDRMIFR